MPSRAARGTWRLAATNTHLYPGARLLPRDGLDPPRRGDAVWIEFADQAVAVGKVLAAATTTSVIEVAPYRTTRGTAIARKVWTLGHASAAAPGWKVTSKGEATSAATRAAKR